MIELPEGMSDEMWWALAGLDAAAPIPLAKADTKIPFVYERKWGLFYVPGGRHQVVMSLLLAFQLGLDSGIAVAEKLDLGYPEETADHWLEHTQGAAFRSSVARRVHVGGRRSLNRFEQAMFGDVCRVFD